MSTIKSKKLQVGTDATSSNNFTIYQPATPDGTLRIGVGNADSPTEVARFDSNGMVGGGKVLQVVSTTKTDTFSTTGLTSSMATLTGLTASITPSSTSSKILVMLGINLGSANDTIVTYQLYRDTTAISQGDAASNRPRVTGVSVYVDGTAMQYGGIPISTQYLDSPSTTSSITYSVKIGSTVGNAVYCNRTSTDRDTSNYDARSSSTITIMEIAG